MTSTGSSDRQDLPRCGAKKRQGDGVCTQAAGWGTDHAGTGACKLHGGSTRNQAVSAGRRKVEAEARQVLAELGVQNVADPLQALLKLAGQVLAWQEATAALVNELESIRYRASNGTEQLRAEIALYERAMDRAAQVLGLIARLNIEERLVRVTERQADALVGALEAGLAAIGITGAQAVDAKRAAARHLRALPAGATDPA